MDTAARLLEKNALYQTDMPHMTKLIETVIQQQGQLYTLASLAQALSQLNALNKEVRLNVSGSPLAKTISGIAADSAATAVQAEATSATPTATVGGPLGRSRWWDALTADVTGAFTGAGTAATILAVPGFPVASLAALGIVGPTAVAVPVLGALIGAGMMSGIDLARSRP
jgi:hypothetical protein